MATAIGKAQCSICGKPKSTYSCRGCLKDFCFHHLKDHRQILGREFDEIENDRDQFRQILIEQKDDPKKHLLIQEINEWENDSINKIKQTAEECRQILTKHTNKYIIEIENKLTKLTEKLRQSRQENEFNEIDLNQFKTKLTQLTEQLTKSSNFSTRQDPTSFINKISIIISSGQLDSVTPINFNTKWIQNGITIAGGNNYGNRLNQLYLPQGIYVDDDQTIYIADWNNHRIVEWKNGAKSGQIVAGGNGKGNRTDQLNGPTNVIVNKQTDSLLICDSGNRRVMQWSRRNNKNGQIIISDIDCSCLAKDNLGHLYVSDNEKHEVRRWKIGDSGTTIIAGGNGQGNHLDQLNCPSSIFVDEDYSVYVSDEYNHRVMKWMNNAKAGIIVAGGKDQGDSLTQLSYPRAVIVDQLGQIYVADSENHRVIRWCKDATEGSVVVGGNEEGKESNQFYCPRSLSFDRQGNLYVSDYRNYRIQKFNIDLN